MTIELINCSACGKKCCSCALPCKCKRGRCNKCGRCSKESKCPHKTAIKCSCKDLKRKQRNERRRLAKNGVKKAKTVARAVSFFSPPTTRRPKEPSQNVLSNKFDAATPGTLAKHSLLNNKKLNTPQQKTVLKGVLDPSDRSWILDEEIPRFNTAKEKASFDTTTITGRAQTSGDVVQVFGIEMDNLKRRTGPQNERANNSNFPSRYPTEFKTLGDIACSTLQKTTSLLAPSCEDELGKYVCRKMLGMNPMENNEGGGTGIIQADQILDFYNKCNQRSTERRTLGALLYFLNQESNLGRKLPARTRVQRKEDFEELSVTGRVKDNIVRRQNKSPEVIEDVVKFLLSEENAITLSWGTKRKVIDGKDINLPKIVRRMQIFDLWALYSRSKNGLQTSERIGRTSFYRIAREITTDDSVAIACIDYVDGNLINDPTELMQRVIDIFFTGDEKRELTRMLTKVRNFLKYQFDLHLKKEDGDGFHGISYALKKPHNSSLLNVEIGDKLVYKRSRDALEQIVKVTRMEKKSSVTVYTVEEIGFDNNCSTITSYAHQMRKVDNTRPCTCAACKFPSWFCRTIENKLLLLQNSSTAPVEIIAPAIETEATMGQLSPRQSSSTIAIVEQSVLQQSDRYDIDEALHVVRDIGYKYRLYQSHRARVICQRKTYDDIIESLREECEHEKRISKSFIIVDWKMKFEPLSSRETMPENFGKRGLPWHGVAIIYFVWNDKKQCAEMKNLYIDQIVEGSSKQDYLAVFGLLEATVLAINDNIPNIAEAILCADNAGCYTSHGIISMIFLLNARYKDEFFISRYIHSETQDGKGLVDRHFARAMYQTTRYMKHFYTNKIRRINTARGLAYALQSFGGMRNSIVQLVQLDRSLLDKFHNSFKKVSTQMGMFFSKIKDFKFQRPSDDDARLIKESDLSHLEEFFSNQEVEFKGKLSARMHSIGDYASFDIDFSRKKIVLDEVTRMRIDAACIGIQSNQTMEDEEMIDNEILEADECSTLLEDCSPASRGLNEDYDDQGVLSNLEFGETPMVEENDIDIEEELDSNETFIDLQPTRPYSDPKYDRNKILSGTIVVEASYFKKSELVATSVTEKRSQLARASTSGRLDQQNQIDRRDVVAVAIRYADKYVSSHSEVFVDGSQEDKTFEIASSHELQLYEVPFQGYARRDIASNLFGARYIDKHNFKQIVEEEVERGNADKSYKKSPAEIHETIKKLYPSSLMIPTEYEIRTEIQKLLNRKESQTNRSSNLSSSVDPDIKLWCKEYLLQDINSTPESVWKEMRTVFGLTDGVKADYKKKIITPLKTEIKKEAKKYCT